MKRVLPNARARVIHQAGLSQSGQLERWHSVHRFCSTLRFDLRSKVLAMLGLLHLRPKR
jgi:hypothetical protein